MDFPMSVGPCSSKRSIIFWKGKKESLALGYFIVMFKIMQNTYRPFMLLLILNHSFLEMQGRDGSLKSVALVMYHKMLCILIKHSKNNVDRCFGLHSCWGTVSKANPKGFHVPEVLTENNRI